MAKKRRRSNGRIPESRVEGDTLYLSGGRKLIIPHVIEQAVRYAAIQPNGRLCINRFLWDVYRHPATPGDKAATAEALDKAGVSRRRHNRKKKKRKAVPTVTSAYSVLQEFKQQQLEHQPELEFIDVEPEELAVSAIAEPQEEQPTLTREEITELITVEEEQPADYRWVDPLAVQVAEELSKYNASGVRLHEGRPATASAAAEPKEQLPFTPTDIDLSTLLGAEEPEDPLAWVRPFQPPFVFSSVAFPAQEDKLPNPVFKLERTV